MNVLICGIDGYIGWALAHRLRQRGDRVIGLDNHSRRMLVAEMGSDSAIPILRIRERDQGPFRMIFVDMAGKFAFEQLEGILRSNSVDAVVHLAHQPSAAWSLRGPGEALGTNINNTHGILALLWAMRSVKPIPRLVTLGTMGEYGTPNIPISEGPIEINVDGRFDRLPFPRQPGSIYHATKCLGSLYVEQACKWWKLGATDVMQGVVYGSRGGWDKPTEMEQTRVDFDECFGTVIHRFCAQAVAEKPMTIYGSGGQTRGYLPLRDSLSCLILALDNPPAPGQYRVFNQLDRCYSVIEIANTVRDMVYPEGIRARIEHIDNPRVESEDHFYQPETQALRKLGYEPSGTLSEDVRQIIIDMMPHREDIAQMIKPPAINWRR